MNITINTDLGALSPSQLSGLIALIGGQATPENPILERNPAPAVKAEKPKAEKPKVETPASVAVETDEEITLETVRKLGSELTQSGKKDAAKKIIAEVGGKPNLADVPAEKLPAVYAAFKELKELKTAA